MFGHHSPEATIFKLQSHLEIQIQFQVSNFFSGYITHTCRGGYPNLYPNLWVFSSPWCHKWVTLPPGPPSLIGFEVRAMSIYGFQFPKHLMAAMGWFWGLKRMSFDSFDSKRPKILTGTGNTQLLQQLSTFLIGLVKVTVTVLKLSIIVFSFFFRYVPLLLCLFGSK